MKIDQTALSMIKDFEGCRLQAYQDLRGRWTIGYGCTHGVSPGMEISQPEADKRLLDDIGMVYRVVDVLLSVELTENQYSALIVLVYNIGSGEFATSTLLEKLNQKDFSGAADEFLRWNHVDGKVVDGLTRRRQAERDLFLATV